MNEGSNAIHSKSAQQMPSPTRNVIIIDDNPHDLNAIEKMVLASRAPICHTTNFTCLDEAITSGKLRNADLILLDDRLEGGSTAEHSLKALSDAGINCPAIVLSAMARRKRDRTVIRHGAVQFASKEDLNPTAMQRLLAYGLTARGLWAQAGN